MQALERLPIDGFLDEIVARVRERRAVVVTAAPGAGKTTRVPPALAGDGRLLLLQPRRVAARAIARRIADEQGWTIGGEVGWHVRFDRRESAGTRLLVATEGILTARIQQDPLLSEFRTVVIDEFHERSIHADLGLALTRQAWLARDDLRIVVMSATLDADRVAGFLGGCPIVAVPGRLFSIETVYRPGITLESVVADEVDRASGALLCFLPGAGEIRRAADRLAPLLSGRASIQELHGSLSPEAQDAALTPSADRRVILATNIAETTLTVPDVRIVVDAGFQKVARYDAERGLESLETERISRDAADQRAGRAGRLGPGRAIRLWHARDRLRPHREPDIARVDLAAPVMDVLAWGGDPRTLEWFEAPPTDALERSIGLLVALGAVDDSLRFTALGRALRRLPLHPRLGRLLLAANGARSAAIACAILSERHFLPASRGATRCDLLSAVDRERDLPPHVLRVARDIRETARELLGSDAREAIDDDAFRKAVWTGYADRVARRRAPGSDRFLLSSGTGARLGRESGVVDAEFIVAVDVAAGLPAVSGAASEAIVRMATRVEREWLRPASTTLEHRLDEQTGVVRALRVERLGAIVLREVAAEADANGRARLVAAALKTRGPSDGQRQLLQRLIVVGHPATFDALVDDAVHFATRSSEVDLATVLSPEARRALERDAPSDIPLPSGRRARLDYRVDGRIVAAVKLQELFGLADTPRLGRDRTPVTFELLAPNGRPVQVTSDLRSFWTTGYQEVRKELRARYPKHPWPEDPWTAQATHRTSKRTPR
ncbi:MAG: ATP-dependent helicase C-terminal domain-containing protein [Acidobacteriota bacterium]